MLSGRALRGFPNAFSTLSSDFIQFAFDQHLNSEHYTVTPLSSPLPRCCGPPRERAKRSPFPASPASRSQTVSGRWLRGAFFLYGNRVCSPRGVLGSRAPPDAEVEISAVRGPLFLLLPAWNDARFVARRRHPAPRERLRRRFSRRSSVGAGRATVPLDSCVTSLHSAAKPTLCSRGTALLISLFSGTVSSCGGT